MPLPLPLLKVTHKIEKFECLTNEDCVRGLWMTYEIGSNGTTKRKVPSTSHPMFV